MSIEEMWKMFELEVLTKTNASIDEVRRARLCFFAGAQALMVEIDRLADLSDDVDPDAELMHQGIDELRTELRKFRHDALQEAISRAFSAHTIN